MGKVYIVGAGPGDPGLITVKGLRILRKADAVLYDRLIAKRILKYAKNAKELVYVGKHVGEFEKQSEINRLLIELAKKYEVVVRLKNGDPILFGRSGEEMEALREAGIEYEVVPGVTSALAAPAYAGIPVTHRDYSSSVAIVTGRRKGGAFKSIGNVVKNVDTTVILMGISSVREIVEDLISSSVDPDTPVAVIENATLPNQRVVVSRVGSLAEDVRRHDVRPPAVIVIGKVTYLYEKLKWFKG